MSVDYVEMARLVRKGRKAERRGKAIENLIVAVLTSVIGAFLGGWFFMLGIGVLHAHWWSELPTIGYWWAVLTVALLRGVFSRTPRETETKS